MRGGVSDSVPPVRAAPGPTGASLLRLGQLPRRSRHHDGAPEPSSTGRGGDRRVPAARHRRIRTRDGAHPARRLLEDEGARHPRPCPHREPGSRSYDPPRIPRSAVSGWSMANSSCPTTGVAGSEADTPALRADGGAELVPRRGRASLRASRTAPRIRRGRCGRAGLPAAGSRGLFARSGGHRTERSPLHRDLARARHASGVPDGLSLAEAQQKSPARRRASLVRSESGQSVPAHSSTSRCASSRVLPYFF